MRVSCGTGGASRHTPRRRVPQEAPHVVLEKEGVRPFPETRGMGPSPSRAAPPSQAASMPPPPLTVCLVTEAEVAVTYTAAPAVGRLAVGLVAATALLALCVVPLHSSTAVVAAADATGVVTGAKTMTAAGARIMPCVLFVPPLPPPISA